jgi:CheY-like chemotaxis protein
MDTNNQGLKTILLADDDRDDREFFRDALSAVSDDIVLHLAENGIEALNMLHSGTGTPDLVFLDLNMPMKNGYECLHDIKQDRTLLQIPIIIFSTSLQRETANEVYERGASLYIIKPNSFVDLKDLLKKVLDMNWSSPSRTPREHFVVKA